MIMNKTVLISVFLSFIAFPCSMAGRDGNMKEKLPFRYEVRLGWGGYPLMDSYMFDESPFGNCDIAYASPSLGNLYRDYTGPKYMTGIISGEFNMIFKKWFTLSIGLNANGEFHYIYDGVTSQCKGSSGTAAISLVPQARFTYLNREYVKLYSSIGAGAVAYISKDEVLIKGFEDSLLLSNLESEEKPSEKKDEDSIVIAQAERIPNKHLAAFKELAK